MGLFLRLITGVLLVIRLVEVESQKAAKTGKTKIRLKRLGGFGRLN